MAAQPTKSSVITATPADTVAGVIAEQSRAAIVLAGVQRDVGEFNTTITVMEKTLQQMREDQIMMRRILQGDDGKNSVTSRLILAEEGVKELRDSANTIRGLVEKASEEHGRQALQIWIMAFTLLFSLGGVILGFLKHP